MTLFQTLKLLSGTLAVSGAESKLSAVIQSAMRPFCDSVRIDAMGNLICEKRSDNAKDVLLLSSHMDEIGFMVTDIAKDGYVSLAPIGYQNPVACAYIPLCFEHGARGVLVPPSGVKPADLDVSNYVADIGAKSRAAASRLVKIGETCVAVSPLTRLSGARISGRALDNKAGVAVLIATAEKLAKEKDLPYHVVYLFSVQEEVGCRGARAAAFSTKPTHAINVDVTDTDDEPGAKGLKKLGEGVCIKYKDSLVLPSRRMISHLEACAASEKIKTQAEIILRGGTDTSVIQSSRSGVISGAISIPERYVHTGAGCVDLKDMEAALSLLCAAVKTPFKG